MQPSDVEAYLLERYDGLRVKDAYAERSLFYNPGGRLPSGVYFVTIKRRDGRNDQSSRLDREGVYRVSFPLRPASYARIFGERPPRPAKGETVALAEDFTRLGQLMPHPVYAWMHFVCINSPEEHTWNSAIVPLLDEAYDMVRQKFDKKTR